MTEVKKNRLLLLMCFLVYSISYIGKYSYSTNIQNVITEFSVSKQYAGYVTSAFFFCYGIGQLLNGILCERMNSKWTITLSLMLSAGITIAMFFLKNIFVMAVLWGANGLILSTLWSHCIKLLATIQDKKYVVKSVTVMSITLPVGVVFSYGCSALFTYFNHWKLTYVLSTVLLFGIALAFFFAVSSMGECTKQGQVREEETSTPLEGRGGKSIFQLFGLLFIPLLFIAIVTGLLRDGASTWLPVLLSDTFNMPDSFSILLTLGLPLMGVLTATASTFCMQKTKNVFGSCLLAGVVSLAVMTVLIFTFEVSFVLVVALFMLLSLAGYILGNTLTSVLPLYYKGELKSGQTAGLINACVYLGSTLSSLCLGGVVDDYGWTAFMWVMLICAVVLAIMSAIGLLIKRDKKN